MLEYQRQASQVSLRSGLAEYLAAFEQHLSQRTLSPEATEFFRCHDIVHIVFGCDLSLEHELSVKISSFMGTNGGKRIWAGYRLPESQEIYGEIRGRDIVATMAASLVLIPRTLWRCLRMHKRWPWGAFDDHMDRSLKDIRDEFGIRVAG